MSLGVARLSRAESIQEAIRVVVCALHEGHPQLRARRKFTRLYETYGRECWLGAGDSSDARLTELGRDGRAVLLLCGERPAQGKEVLHRILRENFTFPADGADPEPLELDARPRDYIVIPHEPDVRVGRKRDQRWMGDKVHLLETGEPGETNFIVDVLTTDPRLGDSTMTEALVQRARFVMPQADTLIGDGGYASAHNSKRAMEPQFIELYRRRAGIEATIAHLVHHCGLRRSRYRGASFRAALRALEGRIEPICRLIAGHRTKPFHIARSTL